MVRTLSYLPKSALVLFLLVSPASAQQIACRTPLLDRVLIVRQLFEKYQETQVDVKVLTLKTIAELFSNQWTHTYTILLTRTDDKSCIIHSGVHQSMNQMVRGEMS